MFRKILIANRGEIACRIIRTCHKMGIAAVAVFSDIDADALHVEMADEAVALGGTLPAESYLYGDAIIAAALARGAQAIHPGYGFLSENPQFVQAVADAGLVFIGPSAEAIRAMGLKDTAKALMERSGVPVVPGDHGSDQSNAGLQRAADRIGYPVLIKAVAGGGGKGMRLVEMACDFQNALASARNEARSAFGNVDVLVEKYITRPRHIEVQVFGDTFGNVVHLYERDCSLQRRHQKVMEESPAPGMTPQMRAAMGQAAVNAAKAIGYVGAGTVEFIVDGSDGLRTDRFWFMEMNTRLQVEHPVTEAVLALDLVEWQIRVAAGQPLPMSQDQICLCGHAVEARLYAEDPAAGFLPATGQLDHLRFGTGVRVETGVRSGDTVSPYYDPMIAKLIAHGPDRAKAMAGLRAAVLGTHIAGLITNRDFLLRLLDHRDVVAGAVQTGLIGTDQDGLTAAAACDTETLGAAALNLVLPVGGGRTAGVTLWAPLEQHIIVDDVVVRYRLLAPDRAEVLCGADWLEFRYRDSWARKGKRQPVFVSKDRVTLFGETTYQFSRVDMLMSGADEETSDLVIAPMPGLVRAVCVTADQPVTKGERLVVLEAMKMEHVLTAGRDGMVSDVRVHEGEQVLAGAALIQLADLVL